MAGSDILGTEEEHKNMKFVDSSFFNNAFTLLINGKMWYETNIQWNSENRTKFVYRQIAFGPFSGAN